jgi:predicted amidohydrolase
MPPVTKVAAVQMNPKLMKKEKNLEKILTKTREAAASGAKLVVFPECALTGYMFSNREEAWLYAETIPGPTTDKIAGLCSELDVHVIFGLLEKDGGKLFNAAAFLGPKGLEGKYRKTHPPFFALDRFVDKGNIPFEVHRTPAGNIGMLICHDLTYPEPARVLMLKGADIIAVLTNWPRQPDIAARHMVNTRAVENFVHIVAADRVGLERKARFLGRSKIVNAAGMDKANASMTKEEIIYADLDLAFPRNKHIVFIPGVWELDYIKERRTELYGDITRPDVYHPLT